MKKFLQKTILMSLCVLFTLACGGGGGNNSSNSSSLENDSLDAFNDSEWSDKTPVDPDGSTSVDIGKSVQTAINNVSAEAITGIRVTKSNKSSSTYNETITGPLGGTALITGTYSYETTPNTVYPINYFYDFKIVFSNYKNSSIAINGEITYTGTSYATNQNYVETEIEMVGGYSVLYQEQAYNVVTKLNADITLTDQLFQEIEYSYEVNGQTFTGSY